MSSNYSIARARDFNKNLDIYIGSRVKFRRSMLGISQDKLGTYLGITFQQIQKYEKGINRVSASMLYNIANMLNVDFSYFVDGFENNETLHDDSIPVYDAESHAKKKESADLLKAYYKINDAAVRKKILELVKTFSVSAKKTDITV